ncbi:MAG: GTP-binding protein [Planctomycetota bacterium]|nr:GTP-binding protein [Planctomycetota bacterium]
MTKTTHPFSGLTYLVVAAIAGAVLMFLPGKILEQYQTVSESGTLASVLYIIAVSVGSLLIVGAIGIIFYRLRKNSIQKQTRLRDRNKNPSQLSSQQKQSEFDENLEMVRDMGAEVNDENLTSEIEPLIRELQEKHREKKLEIVAFGSISSGKSSVLNLLAGRPVFKTDLKGGTTLHRNEIPWPGQDQVFLVDTPGLGEIDGEEHVHIAAEAAKDADIILVVVDGPLREYEFTLLEKLGAMEKRSLICVNKSDWYKPEDRQKLVLQIKEQTRETVHPEDVVIVQAKPVDRVRQRVDPEGNQVEEKIELEPDIEQLAKRMLNIVARDGSDLLLANLLLQSRGIVEQAKRSVEQALDTTAKQIVDKYMWTSGGVAAASPFPLIDLAAGCAVNTKMVMDLAKVYQQNIDLETVTNLIGQMGKTLLTTIGTNTTGPLVAAAVGSMLKTIPGIGTIAGGALQGVAQAIVARWIGYVFIDYFKNEMQQPEGGLAAFARRKWTMLTSVNELRKIVKHAREKMSFDAAPSNPED